MKLFGRAKKAPPPSESLQKMKASADLLEKRIQFLEQKQTEQQEQAKKFLAAGNRRAAMTCLKRKKMYEKQVLTLQTAVDRIEEQCMAIEGASANLEAMQAMKTGASAMKTINQGMSIDQVEDTMDDIQEQMDISNEISDAIARPLGDAYDETELEDELAALEEESLNDQLLDMPSAGTASMEPTATTAQAAKPARSEEDELKALEMSMTL